jgi:putative ABC transport system permease protein
MLHNFGGFIIIFVVMFIITGIMIVPMNLLHTMKSREFISYMGSSMEDILIELESGQNLEDRYETIKKLLDSDSDVEEYREYARVRVETMNSEEEWMNLHIDSGAYAGRELKYLRGNAPAGDNEIALSKLNADAAGKSTGDTMTIRYGGRKKEFVISGIYQDVTSGGYTAKAVYNFAGLYPEKYQFTNKLNEEVNTNEKVSQWSETVGGGYDIEPMEEFIDQTLGGVARQLEVAATAVALIGILLAALIVVLFMKLRLAKDVAQIAAMKAIGFTNTDMRKQYLYKIVMVSAAGILAGTLMSNLFGASITSAAFGMMGLGIVSVTFIINPWTAFVLLPVVILAVTAGMTWISTGQIKDYNIISMINE